MSLNLEQSTQLCRLLADASRLRLLLLLELNELTVAELTEITGLAQSRVSTHLSRLRRAQLVSDRRVGTAAHYSAAELQDQGHPARELWNQLRVQIDDAQAQLDRDHASEVIAARKGGKTWAESVAGSMELHYSPGRTWEATARALIGLLELGKVLDIGCGDGVLSELLASRARAITAVDRSVELLNAARRRLAGYNNIQLMRADMHRLPLAPESFDQVFLMHTLTYTNDPKAVLESAASCLRHGGRLIVAALAQHHHEATLSAYDHVNLGIETETLRLLIKDVGLQVDDCRIRSKESRPPYFEVITALATKP